MTKPPETHSEPAAAPAPRRDRLLSPVRYRHPGDVIRLIIAGLSWPVLGDRPAATPWPGHRGQAEALAWSR